MSFFLQGHSTLGAKVFQVFHNHVNCSKNAMEEEGVTIVH